MPHSTQAPDDDALERLEAFLESPDCPEGSLDSCAINGFMFALACSPDPAPPTQWLVSVFGGALPEFRNQSQADDILSSLLALSSSILEEVKAGTYALPKACEPRVPAIENLTSSAPLQKWSRGFGLGHARTAALWDQLVPREHADDLGTGLLALTFWADTEAIRELRERSAEASGMSVGELAERLLDILPTAVDSYATIGRSITKALTRDSRRTSKTVVRSDKAGRNDPCPCGSGRKHKKCCG